MTDRYSGCAGTGPGRAITRRLGLPGATPLRRFTPGQPIPPGRAHTGGSGRMSTSLASLDGAGTAGPGAADGVAALVYDATGIGDSAGLRALYDFFHPAVRTLQPCGRVVVLGTPPELCTSIGAVAAQRALEGFIRSLGRELGRGRTACLVYVSPGAEQNTESTMRFLLSPRSAYVSGQVIRVDPAPAAAPFDWDSPFDGKVALVTGAAGGIGAATARVLARDGAHVLCLDTPAAGDALAAVAAEVSGSAYPLDLTAPDAPERLAEHVEAQHGGIDIMVHNAGVNRDRTIARMTPAEWDSVLEVNLACQVRINSTLLGQNLVQPGGRLISVSSVSAIAGLRGQTNYATSKAGVIGLVRAIAPMVARLGITVNAVAPGFIDTAMTARMPLLPRLVGRRMNSLGQAGKPVDVAEAVSWLANPGSTGITGSVVRVCGHSLLGA